MDRKIVAFDADTGSVGTAISIRSRTESRHDNDHNEWNLHDLIMDEVLEYRGRSTRVLYPRTMLVQRRREARVRRFNRPNSQQSENARNSGSASLRVEMQQSPLRFAVWCFRCKKYVILPIVPKTERCDPKDRICHKWNQFKVPPKLHHN